MQYITYNRGALFAQNATFGFLFVFRLLFAGVGHVVLGVKTKRHLGAHVPKTKFTQQTGA